MKITFNSSMSTALTQEMVLMKKLELVQLRKKIQDLSTFLPDEILAMRQHDMGSLRNFVGVILYIYISGYTQLTVRYNKAGQGGIYGLTATLDAYVGAIVELLTFYGGDILKFAGNSLLTLWKVKREDSLFEILHQVILCALVVQKTVGKFETECGNLFLQAKIIITCGNLTFTVIGDDENKDFVIVGEAVNDVKDIYAECNSGDVVVSTCSWAHMIQERYDIRYTEKGNIKILQMLYMPNEEEQHNADDIRQLAAQTLCMIHIKHRDMLHAKPDFDSTVTASKITEDFVRTLHPRPAIKMAPKYWFIDNLRPFIIETVQHQIDESQPIEYLTELRLVTVQFINIQPIDYEPVNLIEMVQKAYIIICGIAKSVLGVVNSIFLITRDICVLVSHGLGGIKHEMQGQNALQTSCTIRKEILALEHVSSVSVAITHGHVFCGCVGHPLRREFALIGDSVNKANKMMYAFPSKVTCDHITFKHSKLSSFYFQMINVENNIEFEDFQVFEYNEDWEKNRVEDKELKRIIGRKNEIHYLSDIIDNPNTLGYHGVVMHGHEKVGKTAIVRQIAYKFSFIHEYDVASVELAANVSAVPYFTVSRLYRQLYDSMAHVKNTHGSVMNNIPRDLYDPTDLVNNKNDDIAVIKYHILTTFRDLVRFNWKSTIVLIDNLQYIDLQSWEILEITIRDKQMRLIAAASFGNEYPGSLELKWKISLSENMTLFEVRTLHNKFIASLACYFLHTVGISRHLLRLIELSCDSRPGYVQSCLLSLLNNEFIELILVDLTVPHEDIVFMTRHDKETEGESMPDVKIPRVITLSQKYVEKREQLTLDAISMDLFDSYTPYQQLVIKTGAVLGDIFTRALLKVTLKFPSEITLAQIMLKLFNEEVFDCGSRYLYSYKIETDSLCCRCYFEPEERQRSKEIPAYAYCKILHFKNRNIRKIAYTLLPENHRKDLHLRCTDILEEMRQQCPFCLRQPSFNAINYRTFKEVISYCKDPDLKYGNVHSGNKNLYPDEINAKEAIRKSIRQLNPKLHPVRFVKVVWDPRRCQCFEIMSTIYRDLIYHSERAEHLYKLIYYSLFYGILLNYMTDYMKAMEQLLKARERMFEVGQHGLGMTNHNFMVLHSARIDMALGHNYMRLRQMRAARSHLALALRQFNVPLLAWSNKLCNNFLTRSAVVRMKRIKPTIHRCSAARHDMGLCLMMCAQLFIIEGNVKMCRATIAYSVCLMANTSPQLPIMFDAYCTAVDLYSRFTDSNTCVKLHRCLLQELQVQIGNNRSFEFLQICSLVMTVFEERSASGNIVGAIRLGYRLIDLNLSIFSGAKQMDLFNSMIILLVLNFKLRDAFSICRMCYESISQTSLSQQDSLLRYYTMSLGLYLLCGFLTNPMDQIITFIHDYFGDRNADVNNLTEVACTVYTEQYYLREGKMQEALRWQYLQNITHSITVAVFKLMSFLTESTLIKCVYSKRYGDYAAFDEHWKHATNLLAKIDSYTETKFRTFRFKYLCYKAWFYRIKKHKMRSNYYLNKSHEICVKQENYYGQCLGKALKTYWSGGFSMKHDPNFHPSYKEADSYTLDQWTHVLYLYPIE